MEALFGLIIGVFLVAIVLNAIYYAITVYIWPFIVEVVLPIVSTLMVLFLVAVFSYSIFIAIKDVAWSIGQVRSTRRAAVPVLFHNEARIGYVFGPVWEDVRSFFGLSLGRGLSHISDAAAKFESADTWIGHVFHGLNWLFASTFGLLTTVFVTALMTLAGLITALVLAVTFGFLYIVDVTYMSLRGVFARCPTCHHKSFHLYYDCPSCSGRPQRHRHLRPNRAGALYHTCTCGAAIPAHVLTGRGRHMKAFCSLNEHPIGSALIGTRVTHIAMVGGPDSGKSTLLVGIMRHLIRDSSYASHSFRIEDPIQQRTIDGWIRDLDSGVCPPKTSAERHRATTVLFEDGPSERHSLYLFDTSGEMFSNTKLMAAHTYFDNSDFILFALDPLSLMGFFDYAKATLDSIALRDASPSRERPVAVASSLISLMDANGAKRVNGRFIAPLALVLTKSDLIEPGGDLASEDGIAAWIGRFGGGDLMRLLEANFKDLRLRHVSSLNAAKPGKGHGLDMLVGEIVAQAQAKTRAQGIPLRRRA